MFVKVKIRNENIAYFINIDNIYNVLVGYSDNDGRPIVIDIYHSEKNHIRLDANRYDLDALYAAIECRIPVCG